jgi:Na+/H+ antiporter NhaD/arsenite permease-like protein
MTPMSRLPPTWTLIPFGAYLLSIAFVPFFFDRFWGKNRNKLALAGVMILPVVGYLLGSHGAPLLVASLKEYAAFLTLLAALFVISGGIHLRGSLAGTPLLNTAFLGLGAVLASLIGTTGASMLLIRPLLRANEKRLERTHLVIFFIFIVSNGGGMLTPLGDPPLFLGFLRGVPFLWTLKLAGPWALVNGVLLVLFSRIDRAILKKEERERPGPPPGEGQEAKRPLRIEGVLNVLWLIGVIAINSLVGLLAREHHWSDDRQKLFLVVGMGGMAWLSLATTARDTREANRFTWGPIVEVAVVFLGIFVTMVPALEFLKGLGESGRIRLDRPWEYFWASGMLSSLLDNAPTYLTFASLASGVVGGLHHVDLEPTRLDQLLRFPEGIQFLSAISCGSVLMGANTYIGNGPNFMVKAIAEENHVRMPSFVGYMAWSAAILMPLFIGVTVLFFRG